MNVMTMAALSLLAGFVAAGFVWFGWGVVENLLAMRPQRADSEEASSENEGE